VKIGLEINGLWDYYCIGKWRITAALFIILSEAVFKISGSTGKKTIALARN
jgi:hypothetical protein